jgi:hypothetical protein
MLKCHGSATLAAINEKYKHEVSAVDLCHFWQGSGSADPYHGSCSFCQEPSKSLLLFEVTDTGTLFFQDKKS